MRNYAASTLLLASLSTLHGTANAGVMEYVGPAVANPAVLHIIAIDPSKDYADNISQGHLIYDGVHLDLFCGELYQDGQHPSEYASTIWNDGSIQQRLISRLYSNFYATYRYSPVGNAAMQGVIWEVMDDAITRLNFDAGQIRLGDKTDPNVRNLADTMLSTIQRTADSSDYVLTFYKSDVSQDLLGGTLATSVPLPATASLLGLGSLGLFGLNARRRRS